MRQNFNLNKKRLEEAKRKKREEKIKKRLNKKNEAPSSEPLLDQPNSDPPTA